MAESQSQWVNPIFPVHNKANPSFILPLHDPPSGFFFLSHSNDNLYGRRRIKGILTHSFLGILLQKTFWSLLSSHFLVIDWLYKETKLVETPSIVRTLRGLLFQMQNFRFRSWAHEQIRQICFRFFEFYVSLSLRLRPLLSLFLPHFLFAGTLILMGKGFGEALSIIGLNRKEV